MLALLAPVPFEHLSDAVEIANSVGNVAFGSGAPNEESSGAWSFDFFRQETLEKEVGHLPVLIYVSHDPGMAGLLRVKFRGIYNGFERALPNGKHKFSAERPKTTATDGPFAVFWRVKSLEKLPTSAQIFLSKCKTWRAGKPHLSLNSEPRRPQLVFTPD